MAFIALYASCQPDPKGGKLGDSYWTLTSMKVEGKTTPVSNNTRTTLIFSGGKINGNAPCNSYFGEYHLQNEKIRLSDLGVTKRSCEQMDIENAFLSLLSKATAFSVRNDKLDLFCTNGQLTFLNMKKEEADAIRYEQGVGKLASQFPLLDGKGDAIHLHPIVRVDDPGNYPFIGNLIDTSFYRFFNAEIREIWADGGGEVLAVGQFGGFYICRVPGRYVSSDIAIFTINDGEMKHLETIAWAWCDEGWCNQQDAWLSDADQDGLTDVYQHYTLTDDRGKLKEERLTLLRQTAEGRLLPDKSVKMDKANFKMAKI